MSHANVEIIREDYEEFAVAGQLVTENVAPEFAWDMSNFHGWPEQQVYEGVEGAETFLSDWLAAWDDWKLEVEELHDAGDKVVAVLRQRGRSKTSGMQLEMAFAQVWTFRDGMRTRMEMYSDPAEGLRAAGLA